MDLTANEIRLLVVLEQKPLPVEEVVKQMAPMVESEVKTLLYQLDKKYLIVKQPIIGGGCKTCACDVTYAWRLTFKGRQCLSKPT